MPFCVCGFAREQSVRLLWVPLLGAGRGLEAPGLKANTGDDVPSTSGAFV
jgi:hypothetical protein